MTARTRAELAMVGVTLIWGTTFVLVKTALADVSTILFLALRFAVAALVLAAIYGKCMRRVGLMPAAAAGSLLFTAYYLQTEGLKFTTASKSAFLTGLMIPMVPLLGSLVYRIRPRVWEVVGVAVATLGMALMTLPDSGADVAGALNRGDLLSILCAAAFAIHMVLVSHYTPLIGYETVAAGQVAVAALLGGFSSGWPSRCGFI